MDTMDIATASVGMSQASVMNNIGTAFWQRALTT